MLEASQSLELQKLLWKNLILQEIIKRIPILELPSWYLAGGCISQTVWNVLHGFDPSANIKDYDLVYFDSDISSKKQNEFIEKGKTIFAGINAKVELVNQARVHIWYPKEFGLTILPYKNTEEGIASWPTTATCTGIKLNGRNAEIYAAFGLDDLMAMKLRPNKQIITKEMYENKIQRWLTVWPKLTAIPW